MPKTDLDRASLSVAPHESGPPMSRLEAWMSWALPDWPPALVWVLECFESHERDELATRVCFAIFFFSRTVRRLMRWYLESEAVDLLGCPLLI